MCHSASSFVLRVFSNVKGGNWYKHTALKYFLRLHWVPEVLERLPVVYLYRWSFKLMSFEEVKVVHWQSKNLRGPMVPCISTNDILQMTTELSLHRGTLFVPDFRQSWLLNLVNNLYISCHLFLILYEVIDFMFLYLY